MLVWAGSLPAQTAFITVSDEGKNPLSGAHIFITPLDGKSRNEYGITDLKGQLKNTAAVRSRITISYVGYKTLNDTIEPGTAYQFHLPVDPASLGTFVVTSHSVPTRIEESVYNIRVIDRKRIDSQGAMNLRDLLTNDLNIRLSQDAVLGTGIKMQGVGGENVKIMIDGVPVNGRLDGNIDLSQINLNNIEKIEIIEGPSSTTYGSNALGGVINLITKKTQHHSVEGSLQGYYETVGNYNVDARVGYQHKRHFLQVSGGRYFFDGFNTRDSVKRYQTWKPKEQYFADVNYGLSLGALHFRYQGAFFHEMIQSKGVPESPFYVTATDQYFRTIRTTHGLFLNGFVASHHHLDITASYSYYNRRRQTFHKDLVDLDQFLVEENTDRFDQWMSRGIYTFAKPNARVNVQAGYDINVETGEGPRIKDGRQSMGDVALFSSVEFHLLRKKNLVIKPAVRFGYNTRFAMPVVPSLHLRYTPVKGLDIRLSYARGFRAPSLKELYFVFVDVNHNLYGNPDLRSETSSNLTGQISYSGTKKVFTYGVTVGGFYNDIHDQIRSVALSITPDSNIFRNENISRFQSAGGQASLRLGYKGWQLSLGATYTGVLNGVNDSASGTNRFVFYPELQANTSYFFKWWNGQLSVFFKYTGEQPVLYTEYDANLKGDVIRQGSIGDFSTLDVTYTQSFFKKRLQIGVFGKNLLNVTDIRQTQGIGNGGAHSSGSANLPTLWGRSLGISIKYNFIVR